MRRPAPAGSFRFFDLQVVRTGRVGASTVRVTFRGVRLGELIGGGRDQRITLFLPHPHQDAPVLPSNCDGNWFTRWRAMDPAIRAVLRSYTVRARRHAPEELDIDFVLHDHGGPATRWAAGARPGDQVVVLGPTGVDNDGVDFRPPPGIDWVLLCGDLTALPAIANILSGLPAGLPARVWLDIPDPADRCPLPTAADARISWQHNGTTLRHAEFPPGRPYAWLAGEAETVRTLRRQLITARGIDRTAITFTGYWRRGVTEEQLRTGIFATPGVLTAAG